MVLERPAPGKHAARSALRHIEQAWLIRQIDPEMAASRSVTGEEESATAIFHALRRRRYRGSDALDPRSHRQKAAVIPFLDALALTFSQFRDLDLKPTLEVDTKAKPRRLRLRLTMQASDGKPRWVYPEPPLGFNTKFNGSVDDFRDAIEALATRRGAASILKLIERRPNYRNRLLYASQGGVPKLVRLIDVPLLRRRDQIFRNLIIFLLVDQHPERQSFVEQALGSFLALMKLVPRDDTA